ncbi:MAG: hypothetical protein K1X35_07650 [Caulobacteraceae bacterium]|nr:hypothetical protein [Caulobacteraceae bacterium]
MLAVLLALTLAEPATTAACVPADEICEIIDPATGQARIWPADVQSLEDAAVACIHFGGEPSSDPQRQRYIESQMRKACNGVHNRLPGLKRKYRGDPDIAARLANIEAYYGGPIP